jgi:hypothetical protein
MQYPFQKVFMALEDFLPGSLTSGLSSISVLKAAGLFTYLEKYFTG